MALSVPVMAVARARTELGWEPRHSSVAAVRELLTGIHEGASTPTPVLRP
jgi:nucleoside-diphosphate-sugar epimerase